MSKQRHEHVIIATITCAMKFNPDNIEDAAAIQKQFKLAAATMVGFRSVECRMSKLPAKEHVTGAVKPADDMPPIPAALKR